jgi:hypothetical protein
MTVTPVLYWSVDDYLGPAETRFFGAGYRRATHDVRDVVVEAGGVRAAVDVGYPVDWSTKSSRGDLLPHLSTVDMLVLGAQLAEAHLAAARGLDEQARAGAWLRRVTLRSGTTPQEELAGLAGTAVLRSTTPVPDAPGQVDSTYDCAVGVMRARLEIRHPWDGGDAPGGSHPELDDLLGHARTRYYGTGFTTQHHDVSDVSVDMAALTAEASVLVLPVDGAPGRGLGGAHQPAVSTVDCFVVNLQLAQILMYELDSLARGESNTLWMLRTVLTVPTPTRIHPDPLSATVAITDRSVVPLRGAPWRNVDIEGDCGGVSLRATFAHQLPGDLARRVAAEQHSVRREGTS